MSAIVQRGPWRGHQIRKGRKPHRCENARAHEAGNAPNCDVTIRPGQYYLETEVDPDEAGGFGMKKMCMWCAGDEAHATVDYQARRRVNIAAAKRLGIPVDGFGRYDERALLAGLIAERDAAGSPQSAPAGQTS